MSARKTRKIVSNPPDSFATSLDRANAELDVLRALANGKSDASEYHKLVRLTEEYHFSEPEYQVVCESLRDIAETEPISSSRLAVHLNNRGFPDIDLEKYFEGTPPDLAQGLALARKLQQSATDIQ